MSHEPVLTSPRKGWPAEVAHLRQTLKPEVWTSAGVGGKSSDPEMVLSSVPPCLSVEGNSAEMLVFWSLASPLWGGLSRVEGPSLC